MEFFRQEFQSGLPFPSPGDLPDPGIEPEFPAWQDTDTQVKYLPRVLKQGSGRSQGSNLHLLDSKAYAPSTIRLNLFGAGCLIFFINGLLIGLRIIFLHREDEGRNEIEKFLLFLPSVPRKPATPFICLLQTYFTLSGITSTFFLLKKASFKSGFYLSDLFHLSPCCSSIIMYNLRHLAQSLWNSHL